eukprot:COSAG04_NODE_691_length_11104_cov_6.949841_16_plen_75_part_00
MSARMEVASYDALVERAAGRAGAGAAAGAATGAPSPLFARSAAFACISARIVAASYGIAPAKAGALGWRPYILT